MKKIKLVDLMSIEPLNIDNVTREIMRSMLFNVKHTTGKTLQMIREEADITQDEIANKLKISQGTISAWENDTKYPTFENVLKLCKLYGLSTNETLNQFGYGLEENENITDFINYDNE